MDAAGEKKPEVDPEAYARYQALMKREFDESPYTAIYRAEFQARKDAKIARAKAKAVKTEPSTLDQSPSLVPPKDPTSDGEDPLQAWNPRKHRQKHERSPEPTGNDTVTRSEHGCRPPSAVTNTLTVNTASAGLGSKRHKQADTAPEATTSPSTKTRPLPKSRKSSGASETLPDRRKRSAGDAFAEDRRSSVSKQARRTSTSASGQLHSLSESNGTGIDRHPPKWYTDLAKPNGKRDRNQSTEETSLTRIKDAVRKLKASNVQERARILATQSAEILNRLHKLVFLPVTPELLRKTRMLDNADGLPQLFDREFSGGVDWPWYLRADAEELYNKCYMGVFETDPFRGVKRALRGKGKSSSSNYDKLDEGSERFKLVDPKQHGNGRLINGSCWPTQLTVLRDGGHGSSQGGITSHPVEGAFSVIISGGLDSTNQPYPNIDRGNEVLYCGTDNHSAEVNEPSRETRAMILNLENKRPVRLFRSSNLGSPYAPEQGFRYDGLYQVADIELMDPPEEKRKRHRFKLVRCDAQDPIRYAGLAKRPTKEELEEYEIDKKNRGR